MAGTACVRERVSLALKKPHAGHIGLERYRMPHYAGSAFLTTSAVLSGTVWTYLYGRKTPLPVRLCAGACAGFAVMATLGFSAACWLGMNRAALWIAVCIVTAPSIFLLGHYRIQIAAELSEARQALLHPTRRNLGYVAFYTTLAVLLGMVFSHAMYYRADGIYTGVLNDLGDLPFHLHIIQSFAQGQNFPPEDPGYVNVRFAYPFLCDFLAAMLIQAGASLRLSLWVPNFILAIAMVGLIHYWTLELTRDRLAGVIAPVLILFSGGLGWWLLFRDVRASDSGIVGLLADLPRDYTIANDTIWRWGNSLTALFIPQRSILFGIPLAIIIFTLWWQSLTSAPEGRFEVAITNFPKSTEEKPHVALPAAEETRLFADGAVRRMIAAGVLAGMLPLIHSHTFIVIIGIAACLALLFRQWRAWLAFAAPALIIGIPEMLWSLHGSGIRAQAFLGWYPGWDRGDANPIWFWFVNTGAFVPLLVAAILWVNKGEDLVPTSLLRFYLPFTLCFILPNLVKFAPWGWDNIKILFSWYVASVPLVALLLSCWLRQGREWRWAAIGLLLSLTLAGSLELVRVLAGTEEAQEFDADGIAIARQIIDRTEPRSLVLHSPGWNTPVYLTGRRSLLGYLGAVWSRGLDYAPREQDLQQIYAGSPQARSLMQHYHVDYVLIGPLERTDLTINEEFWKKFPVVASSGDYRLYRVEFY